MPDGALCTVQREEYRVPGVSRASKYSFEDHERYAQEDWRKKLTFNVSGGAFKSEVGRGGTLRTSLITVTEDLGQG